MFKTTLVRAGTYLKKGLQTLIRCHFLSYPPKNFRIPKTGKHDLAENDPACQKQTWTLARNIG